MEAHEEQWRALCAHVLIRACADAAGPNPKEREKALTWLNSPAARGLANSLGLHIAGVITSEDLIVPKRNMYFSERECVR